MNELELTALFTALGLIIGSLYKIERELRKLNNRT